MEPLIADPDFTLYVGDVREVLRELPAESVHTVVTSPPYWGLRDYGSEGQIGLEATPDEYVASMVDVFREVRRVLRSDGTLWLNLGDSYAGIPQTRPDGGEQNWGLHKGPGLKVKDLVGIPWRVAFALQADGWYLRSDIIWAKPNPMPESVKDRPTKAHEYVFLLTKQPKYFFDDDAVREPFTARPQQRLTASRDQPLAAARVAAGVQQGDPQGGTHVNRFALQEETLDGSSGEAPRGPDGRRATAVKGGGGSIQHRDGERWPNKGRNVRSVWEIASQPYKEAHFATFPEALPDRCIRAGCPEWVCADCGRPMPPVGSGHDSSTTAAMRGVRHGVPETDAEASAVLLEEVREWEHGSQSSVEQGLRDRPEGLQVAPGAAAPDGKSRGVRDGASSGDGGAPGTAVDEGRSRSSPERGQAGQPTGEPHGHAQTSSRSSAEAAPETDYLSALRRGDHHVWTCPACGCRETAPGVTLDPFAGSGTVALVARKLGRNSVGIELNPEYAQLAARRLQQLTLL